MPGTNFHVLVVEENPVQAALHVKLLKAGRHRVTSLDDPVKLVSTLATTPVPDLLLLDITPPGMDGIDLLQRLEADPRWCGVPAILMAATATGDRVAAAQRLPVPPEGFLVKPVDLQGLLRTVRAVLYGNDTVQVIRRLQRKRLALRLSLNSDIISVEEGIRRSNSVRAECESRIARQRKEMVELRRVEPRLEKAPFATRSAMQEKFRKLEESLERYRRRLRESAVEHKRVLLTRQEIVTKTRALCELERQIESLVGIHSKDAGSVSPGRVRAVPHAAAPPSGAQPSSSPEPQG